MQHRVQLHQASALRHLQWALRHHLTSWPSLRRGLRPLIKLSHLCTGEKFALVELPYDRCVRETAICAKACSRLPLGIRHERVGNLKSLVRRGGDVVEFASIDEWSCTVVCGARQGSIDADCHAAIANKAIVEATPR